MVSLMIALWALLFAPLATLPLIAAVGRGMTIEQAGQEPAIPLRHASSGRDRAA